MGTDEQRRAVAAMLRQWAEWHRRIDTGYPGNSAIVGFREGVDVGRPGSRPPRNVEIPERVRSTIELLAIAERYQSAPVAALRALHLLGWRRACKVIGKGRSTLYTRAEQGVDILVRLRFGQPRQI